MFLQNLVKGNTFFVFVLCVLCAVSQAQAQVSEDNRSSGGAFSNTGVTTLTFPHTIGNGINRALYVTVSATSAFPCAVPIVGCVPPPPLPSPPAGGVRILTATYNGVALTKLNENIGVDTSVAIFRLTNAGLPPAGTYNVTVNLTPAVSAFAVGNALSFTGVNQLAPNGMIFSNTGNDTMPNVTVTDAAPGDTVLDILGSSPNAGFFAAGAGQKVCLDEAVETTCTRGRRFFNTAFDVGASSTEPGASSAVLMSWTMTTAAPWFISATAIKAAPVATAAAITIGGRVLTVSGRGIPRAFVHLTDADGDTRTTLTNSFGYFRFRDVAAGETYTFRASSKRYKFTARLLNVNEESSELNFTAVP